MHMYNFYSATASPGTADEDEVEKQINEGTELAPEKIRQIDACIFFVRTIRLNLVGQVYYNNGKVK